MKPGNSLRTLFLTQFVPYPPAGGAALRNWQNICLMQNFGPVATFAIVSSSSSVSEEDLSALGIARQKAFFVDNQNTPTSILNKLVWWSQPDTHYITDKPFSKKVEIELEQFIQEFSPDVIIVEELALYRYLSAIKTGSCQIILDNHNVESYLFAKMRKPQTANPIKHLLHALLMKKLETIEKDFVQQSNQVWLCSDVDAKLLEKTYQKTFGHLQVIPNGIDTTYYDSVRLNQSDYPENWSFSDKTIIFPATFAYAPNKEAARLLIEEIFPRLQAQYPESCLVLAGRNPTEGMLEAAHQNSQIVVTGQVKDMRPYLAASSIMVVPLLQGSGTRLKILEAFAAGRPVVSTAKGAEGLNVVDGQHLLIRETADDMVNAIASLWSDTSYYQQLAENAYALTEAEYSWSALGKTIEHAVSQLLDVRSDLVANYR